MVGAAIAGFIFNTAFAPFNFWFAAPLALAWLLRLLSDQKIEIKIGILLLFGFSFYLPLLSWSNTYVGNLPWILLALLQTIFILPLAFINWSVRSPARYALFPSLWIAIEWVLGHFPFGGFGWGRVGFSQADSPYSQWARIGGVPMLSFFVASLAVVALWLYLGENKIAESARFRFLGRITGGVLAVLVLLSLSLPLPRPTSSLSVLAVQGGAPKLGLDFNLRAKAVYSLHLNATKRYLSTNPTKPDVVVWPENSIDVDPFQNIDILKDLEQITSQYNVPLIAGAVTEVGNSYYNESILWAPEIGPQSRYIKQHLTPFGEYIPLRKFAERISPFAAGVTDFSPGAYQVMHRVGAGTIAPIICYELLDDSLGRSINATSNLMLVQTNSATFGLSAESAQQLNITRIRAIEHQRFVVSVATTGISAFIEPTGKIMQQTPQNRQVVTLGKVGLIDDESFADRFGSSVEGSLIGLAFPLFWVTGKRR